MEEDQISRLFKSVAEGAAGENEDIREVFSILVRSTLNYRDRILKAKGVTVKVEDVKAAIEWLAPALVTGRLPVTDDKIRLDLLKLWLDELNPTVA